METHPVAAPAFCQTRWFRAGLLLALPGLAAAVWSTLCTAPGIPWNVARLAPSFALAQGLPIYALRDTGAQLGWFYGPVFPLWNLPATLTANPTWALVIAAALNWLTWLGPVFAVLWAAGLAARSVRLAGVALAGLLLAGNEVTRYGVSFVHVDAVCLAGGVLACVALHRALLTGRRRWLHLAVGAALLACWSKQTAVILLPALAIWWWRAKPAAGLRVLLYWFAVYGALSALVVFLFFGAPEILFNLWLVHVRNPMTKSWVELPAMLGRLVGAAWPWLPAALVALWLKRTERDRPLLPPPAADLARLLLWVALWQLPLGLLAALKAGGGLNSVHALHYALLAGLVALGHALERRTAGAFPLAGLVWLCAVLMPLAHGLQLGVEQKAAWTVYRGQEQLLAMARQQPGRYYFPWNPLVTLIAERRVQPLDDALYCLWNAGLEIPAERVRAAVPRNPIILYEEPAQSHFALRYFPPPSARPPAAP